LAKIAKDRDLQVRVVYAPFYKKVILFDGKQALWIKNAFTDNEKKLFYKKLKKQSLEPLY